MRTSLGMIASLGHSLIFSLQSHAETSRPELTLRWAPCQGRRLRGECRRSCEDLGVRHQTQSLQDGRFPPTTKGKSQKQKSGTCKGDVGRRPCCLLRPSPQERPAELFTEASSILAESCRQSPAFHRQCGLWFLWKQQLTI